MKYKKRLLDAIYNYIETLEDTIECLKLLDDRDNCKMELRVHIKKAIRNLNEILEDEKKQIYEIKKIASAIDKAKKS